jgi:hypothetical protein
MKQERGTCHYPNIYTALHRNRIEEHNHIGGILSLSRHRESLRTFASGKKIYFRDKGSGNRRKLTI